MLASHLPVEASSWTDKAWSRQAELLAVLIERFEAWAETIVQAAYQPKSLKSPGRVQIPRPGEAAPDEREPARAPKPDAGRITAFFSRFGGKGG